MKTFISKFFFSKVILHSLAFVNLSASCIISYDVRKFAMWQSMYIKCICKETEESTLLKISFKNNINFHLLLLHRLRCTCKIMQSTSVALQWILLHAVRILFIMQVFCSLLFDSFEIMDIDYDLDLITAGNKCTFYQIICTFVITFAK